MKLVTATPGSQWSEGIIERVAPSFLERKHICLPPSGLMFLSSSNPALKGIVAHSLDGADYRH